MATTEERLIILGLIQDGKVTPEEGLRLLDALEQTGQIDQTLIVFTADHGEHLGDYQCFGKRSMLDSAARIPLIARLPGRFAAGTSCGAAASLVDVMPTALAAAGIPCSGNTRKV